MVMAFICFRPSNGRLGGEVGSFANENYETIMQPIVVSDVFGRNECKSYGKHGPLD
jgi:hypothetical protein